MQPIVPIAIAGVRHVLPQRTWLFRHGPITLTIGAPLEPMAGGWPEMVRLRDAAVQHIAPESGGVTFATRQPHEEADMQLTPTITFRGVERTTTLETDILTRLRKLETYYRGIMGCRVLVELLQRHHEAGNRYHVRIDLTVPGEELVVAHEAGLHATAQDVDAERLTKVAESDPERKHAHVAIREAFDIARRRLQDYARRQRGAVKTATKQARGRVSQLFPIDNYGYIEADNGHEVYFQKSSVLKDAFDRLAIGSAVSFVEEPGEKGPQASTVKLLHPRRVHRASHAARGARVVR